MTLPPRVNRGKQMGLTLAQQKEIWAWYVERSALGTGSQKAEKMGVDLKRFRWCVESLKRRKYASVV